MRFVSHVVSLICVVLLVSKRMVFDPVTAGFVAVHVSFHLKGNFLGLHFLLALVYVT